LVKEEESLATSSKKIFRTTNYMNFDKLAFLNSLSLLTEAVETEALNTEYLKDKLKKMISTYKPSEQ
jgi:hypothetical protein